jgi:glucan 1,3-beta-glucosidase
MQARTFSVQGADRLALDTHPYFAFAGAPLTTPQTAPDSFPPLACKTFSPPFQASQTGFGLTLAGEFSGAINDCGLFLLGPAVTPNETAYESNGGNCDDWTVWENWNSSTKGIVQDFVEAQMDSMSTGGGWFFWTWKIGPGSDGNIRSPGWSYQLGLENG